MTEERASGETTKDVKYGEQYTLTLTGFESNVNQVKVLIPEGCVTDKYGNSNKATELIIYNTLKPTYTGEYNKETNSESRADAPFLGNANIQRQNIYSVVFEKAISSNVYNHEEKKITDTTRAWDVSAQGDESIVAWYADSEIKNGTYKIHIANNSIKTERTAIDGSVSEIFANQDSRDLFAYIGYSENCTETEVIKNIDLLNVANATNMSGMFEETGHQSMTKLDLGDKFDTSNVTNMESMFQGTGYYTMATFNLGSNFNTNKVTNMSNMFVSTGYMQMTGLDLGGKFNTSNVTDMSNMFNATGHDNMTTLNLGNDFDTSIVTNMSGMFYQTGHEKMATLNLGEKFNTISVTNMDSMFEETGYALLTNLNLGSKFDTSSVESMNKMFYKAGHEKMTTLNLGGNFNTTAVKDMTSMFEETGLKVMTKLDLGDKFYTTSAENMSSMFKNTGATLMVELDLGPAFTKIADEHSNMFAYTGKDGEVIIHASEQIYKNKNNFKLDSNATDSAINYTRGECLQ